MPRSQKEADVVYQEIRTARDELKNVRREGAAKATAELKAAQAEPGEDLERLRTAIAQAAEFSLPLKVCVSFTFLFVMFVLAMYVCGCVRR